MDQMNLSMPSETKDKLFLLAKNLGYRTVSEMVRELADSDWDVHLSQSYTQELLAQLKHAQWACEELALLINKSEGVPVYFAVDKSSHFIHLDTCTHSAKPSGDPPGNAVWKRYRIFCDQAE